MQDGSESFLPAQKWRENLEVTDPEVGLISSQPCQSTIICFRLSDQEYSLSEAAKVLKTSLQICATGLRKMEDLGLIHSDAP